MANTISTSMIGTPTPSISQLNDRDVSDVIRYLGVGNAFLTSLIENSMIVGGTQKQSKGLITKRAVEQVRYEIFTRSPRPSTFTVTAGTEISSSGVTFSSVNGLPIYGTLINPRNNTTCRVESITTLTAKGSSFGSTTFSCTTGDVLILGAPAYPSGSTESTVINGTDDNSYNMLQYSRWSCSVSWEAEAIKYLAGGDRLKREKMYLLWEALADVDRTLLGGNYTGSYASKNTTTGSETGYTGEYPTTKGFIQLAANSYDAEGDLTLSKWLRNVPLAMDSSVNDNMEMIGLCSNEQYARMQEWVNDKQSLIDIKAGDLSVFGIKCENFRTSGPTIKIVKHDYFNKTDSLKKKMLIMAPSMLEYCYLKGHDMQPNNGIQTNATHGTQDEIYAKFGASTKDAGKSMLLISNTF